MQVPWEALATLFLAIIGFIAWLVKMSTDVGHLIRCLESIEKSVHSFEAVYIKKEDIARDMERLENSTKMNWNKYETLKDRVIELERTSNA